MEIFNFTNYPREYQISLKSVVLKKKKSTLTSTKQIACNHEDAELILSLVWRQANVLSI